MNPAPVRKAVFPVAGLGTRFLPATKSTPKEMLPIVDKPLIQYAAEEAVEGGCDGLVFITSRMKHSISDHFDSAYELEQRLEADGKTKLLERCRNVLPARVSRQFVPQPEALGLGHAVLCAKPAVGNEPFAVLLADDLIRGAGGGCIAQMMDIYRRTGASVIAVQPVSEDQVNRYGIVALENESRLSPGNAAKIRKIVEKPPVGQAPSNLAVVGRYLLTPRIFELLESQPPGAGGEIQLTDAIARLLEHEPVYAYRFEGVRYDCGSKAGYVRATVDYALEHADLRENLLEFLDERLEAHLQTESGVHTQ